MKIVDIMKESAMLLGLTKDRVVMETITEENEINVVADNPNIASLFNLIKYSIRELCTNYVPVKSVVTVKTENNKYEISSLPNYIRILSIYQNSQIVKFKVVNRNILFEEDGIYEIHYATYPEISSVLEEIDYLENFSPDVIVLGLCSYFSLAHGMFTEFEDLHEKYVEKAESLKNLKIFEIPCRRWE